MAGIINSMFSGMQICQNMLTVTTEHSSIEDTGGRSSRERKETQQGIDRAERVRQRHREI